MKRPIAGGVLTGEGTHDENDGLYAARFAMELGYYVTPVRDATAAFK